MTMFGATREVVDDVFRMKNGQLDQVRMFWIEEQQIMLRQQHEQHQQQQQRQQQQEQERQVVQQSAIDFLCAQCHIDRERARVLLSQNEWKVSEAELAYTIQRADELGLFRENGSISTSLYHVIMHPCGQRTLQHELSQNQVEHLLQQATHLIPQRRQLVQQQLAKLPASSSSTAATPQQVRERRFLRAVLALNDEALAAVILYTMESNIYHDVNRFLLLQQRHDLDRWLVYINTLLRALRSLPFYRPLPQAATTVSTATTSAAGGRDCAVVYRGMRLSPQNPVLYIPNSIIMFRGFTSTSISQATARAFAGGGGGGGGGVFFTIYSKTARNVAALSVFPAETEILFPAFSLFRVERVTRTGNGVTEVVLEEIPVRKSRRCVLMVNDDVSENQVIADQTSDHDDDIDFQLCVSTQEAVQFLEANPHLLMRGADTFRIVTDWRRDADGHDAGPTLVRILRDRFRYHELVMMYARAKPVHLPPVPGILYSVDTQDAKDFVRFMPLPTRLIQQQKERDRLNLPLST